MSASTPVADNHPLRKAWDAYKLTQEFRDTAQWVPECAVGCLWSAFAKGWRAAGGLRPLAPVPGPLTECDMHEDETH